MKSMNRVFLMGNLGLPPELMESKSGRPYAILRVCTNHMRPKEEGGFEEVPDWHSVFVWGKLAETCARYLGKGAVIFVEGYLSYWVEGGGNVHKSAITAEQVHFLNGRKSLNGGGAQADHLDNPEGSRNHNAVAHPA